MNKSWNVLSWNIRGINSDAKLLAIRNAIDTSGCSVLCIQETKRESFDLAFIKTFCPKRFDKFAFAPSMGASGGIITIWNSSLFVGTPWFIDSFAVGVSFVSTQSNEAWNLVNVYGPCSGQRRADFSSWLFDLNIPSNENWLLLETSTSFFPQLIETNLVVMLLICFCLMK